MMKLVRGALTIAAAVACILSAEDGAVAEEGRLGTGVLINSLGHILTNRHVVDGCSEFTVQTSDLTIPDRTAYRASLAAQSSVFDLAVVRAELPQNRPFAPLLAWENRHVFIPTDGQQIVQGGYPTRTEIPFDRVKISFGYVRHIPGLVEFVNAPKDSHTLEADTGSGGSGSGVFDLHGNLIGLVHSLATSELEGALIDRKLWRTPNYGKPIFFHGLDAIASFLVENKIHFEYQVVGKSIPMQGDAPLHGWVGVVTYMVLCR